MFHSIRYVRWLSFCEEYHDWFVEWLYEDFVS